MRPMRNQAPVRRRSRARPPAEPHYNNWIELSIGGLITNGDTALFEQEHHISGDVFGGIQDLHYEQTFDKNGQFSIDGHAIFDTDDYDLKLELSKPDLGYIQRGLRPSSAVGMMAMADSSRSTGQFFRRPSPRCTLIEAWPGSNWACNCRTGRKLSCAIRTSFGEGQKDSTELGRHDLTGLTPEDQTSPQNCTGLSRYR